MKNCETCKGKGYVVKGPSGKGPWPSKVVSMLCDTCGGLGKVPKDG